MAITEKNIFTVSEEQNGLRLDQFLSDIYPDISRSYLQKNLIQAEKILVNNKVKSKKGFQVFTDDQVEILPFVHPDHRSLNSNKDIKVDKVYENDSFVVYNKPKGLPTHPNRYEDNDTLASVFINDYPLLIDVGEDRLRPGVVHRLDSDTSGCIIFAKSQESYNNFRALFNERKIFKLYLAVVLGKAPTKGFIDTDLAHHSKNTRKMINVTHEGISHRGQVKQAATAYHVIDQNDDYSLLLIKTFTGRMHQVRVHLSGKGYPLVGDKLYQKRQDQHMDIKGEKSHCLHAHYLGFENQTAEKSVLKSDLPEYFLNVLQKAQLNFKDIDPKLLFLSMQEFLDSHPFANRDV